MKNNTIVTQVRIPEEVENAIQKANSIPYRKFGFVQLPKVLRDFVKEIDNYTCYYCGKHRNETNDGHMGVDHMVPKSRGGSSDLNNLVSCCTVCNSRKRNKTAEEYVLKVIGAP